MATSDYYKQTFTNLKDISTFKRAYLITKAGKRFRTKKGLAIASGVLALFSASTITVVLTTYIGKAGLQVVAAVTAAISGVITLLVEISFKAEDTEKIYKGASEYLQISNSFDAAINKTGVTESQLELLLPKLQKEYQDLDETYSHYINVDKLDKYVKKINLENPGTSKPKFKIPIAMMLTGQGK